MKKSEFHLSFLQSLNPYKFTVQDRVLGEYELRLSFRAINMIAIQIL